MGNNILLGAIAGDIIGSVYEFNSIKNYDFLLISDSSTYTDDTVMTIANADWLLTCDALKGVMLDYGYRCDAEVLSKVCREINRITMETNNTIPFAFTEGQSPKDKSQNIIKVIGVGGGGSNAVLNMYKKGVHNVRFAICNTDSQSLAQADIPVKIQLGSLGLGVGGKAGKGEGRG